MQQRRIPLFPLRMVLFPGMILPLHVFEPRYQTMVRHCQDADGMFGVCLIRSGAEVGGPAEPYSVGTTCRILSITPLDGGRMNLVTSGKERFRIVRLFTEQPYLEAEIEMLPPEELGNVGDLPARVQAATRRYISGLLNMYGEQEREMQLPNDPTALSHFVGSVLQIDLPTRQELLEAPTVADRLARQLPLLEHEAAQLVDLCKLQAQAARPIHSRADRISPN